MPPWNAPPPPRNPADEEILKAGVRAGAMGFSTNQNPVHMFAAWTPIQSRFATDEEIIELACALGEINQGAVQISRGSLGVSVPMRETVQLFGEIVPIGTAGDLAEHRASLG